MTHKESTDVLDLFNKKPLVKICAPMVRYTKLQFRNLVKLYDGDVVFTPMILADSVCKSPKARNNEFTTNSLDTPLITQFAANTVHDFVGASYMVAPFCDGVDLNCGCPQRWAREMNLGCQLLNSPQKVFELVRECRNRISKPFTVSVKTRIQSDLRQTVSVCQGLERSGVSFLTIHARTPNVNVGPINDEALKLVTDSVQVPVVGNGGVGSLEECYTLQEATGVKGVMIANGILTNPSVFSGSNCTPLHCVQNWLDICFNSTLSLEAYEEHTGVCKTIPEKPPNLTFQCFHHHLVFMLEKLLTRKQRRTFNNLKTFSAVLEFLEQNFGLTPKLFNRDCFLSSLPLNLDYCGCDVVYDELKPSINDDFKLDLIDYDYNKFDGKYFSQKCDDNIENNCDWSSMFFEND